MTQYVVKRLADMVFVLFGVSVLIFLMIRFIPGDAVAIMLGANTDITPDRVENLRRQLGLHLPMHVQYWEWLNGVLRGDLRRSIWTGTPVAREIAARLPVTLEITGLALPVALLRSVPLGAAAGGARGPVGDVVVRVLAIVGLAVPSFWVGVLLLYLFAVRFPRRPSIGYVPFGEDPLGNLARRALPVAAVSLPM